MKMLRILNKTAGITLYIGFYTFKHVALWRET